MFQNPDDQLFAPTVFEDVAFGPINMGFPEEEVALRVYSSPGRRGDGRLRARKSIHNLSFGQKKRICIAGLLAMGHEILLLDEPTAGLDPMGEYKMMDLLTRLNREKGVTIVMATHSVDLVPLFLDRLYILSKGRIARGGPPEEVFTAPEEMSQVKLRLPQIAELIYRLKTRGRYALRKDPADHRRGAEGDPEDLQGQPCVKATFRYIRAMERARPQRHWGLQCVRPEPG